MLGYCYSQMRQPNQVTFVYGAAFSTFCRWWGYLRVKFWLFAVGLAGMLAGCPERAVEAPGGAAGGIVSIAPERLVLNLPPDGREPAPYPATGSFQAIGADTLSGSWTVENPALASIDGRGVVTAIATGTTPVWFEPGKGTRASASLEVVDRGGLGRVFLQ